MLPMEMITVFVRAGDAGIPICRGHPVFDFGMAAGHGSASAPGPHRNRASCQSSAQRETPSAAVGEGTGALSESRRLAARELARGHAWHHALAFRPTARAGSPSRLLA